MGDSTPALTVWQPWATLIAEGLKPFEFRHWPAPSRLVGKRIAIHAGARLMRHAEIDELIGRLESRGDGWRSSGLVNPDTALMLLHNIWAAFEPRRPNNSLPLSHIVCTAILGQPIRDDELAAKMGLDRVYDSDREEHSNWGWPLTEIRRLEPPAPARGAQGFWKWTPDV